MVRGRDPLEVQRMSVSFSAVESEANEWEPESLPLVIELDVPPSPRRDDAQESDQSARVIVIDLA
jgi:hypothetical protein